MGIEGSVQLSGGVSNNNNAVPRTQVISMLKLHKPSGSWRLAMVIAGLLAVYLLTADVTDINGTHKQLPDTQTINQNKKVASVHAERFQPVSIRRTLTLYGKTQPDRVITVSAEVSARVTGVSAHRGQLVKKGDVLVQLRQGSLPAELEYARAKVRQSELDYQSAQSLQSKKLIADNQLPQLEVALAEARSQLKRIEIQLADTQVQAPVSGILNERKVELGDYIESGKPVANLLDLDPLIIQVDVPQTSIQNFSLDDQAKVRFLNGDEAQARIRFISRQGDNATRTFNMELALENPGMTLPAGLSIETDLLMEEVEAIKVSPALIALDENGAPGIKWVAPDNVVHFTPADIVKTESNSLWLTGLPRSARVITRGQGFVRAGDQVTVSSETTQLLAGD